MQIIIQLLIMKENWEFLLALQTVPQTDRWTDEHKHTFLESPRQTNSNGT